MIRRLHPSALGFWGGVLIGMLVMVFAFGNLSTLVTLIPFAEAQFAPVFRLMDGAHTQLATVDHSGRLLVSTGSTSGLTDHITSVTHIQVSGSGTPGSSLSVRCVNTGGTAFADCGGSGGGDTVNVFHQSTVRHISSVTHVAGQVILQNVAGVAVTVTGTALDVNCTGCAAASVVAVSHISGAVHVVNSFGAALHFQGLGVPGQSHGGVLTIQGVNGGNAVSVGQSLAAWIIAHVSSVTHVYGRVNLIDRAGNYVTVTAGALDVNCTGCSSSATVHISSALHIAGTQNGGRVHISGLGTPGQTHGGVVTVQGVTGMIGLSVYQDTPRWTIAHVTSVTHIVGAVSLVNQAGTYITATGGALDVSCTGCSSSATVHISAALHIAGTQNGGRVHISGLGTPGQSHGGVVTIQGITGANAVSVAQSVANWNINHISAAVHLAGGVTDNANSALRVTGVTVFTVMGAIDHISSAVHVVNSFGKALHIQGLGTPGASHGGVLTIQGINGGNAVSVGQSLARWNIDHITSVTHVIGRMYLTNQAGAAVTVSSGALDVNCTGCSSAATVHISAALHIAGSIQGARLHFEGVGSPGQSHGGVLTIQGVNNGNAVAVGQSLAAWNIAHITSVTHIFGRVNLIDRAGNYVTSTAGALDVNCTGCSSSATVHISAALHIAGSIQGARLHIQGVGTPGQTHGGVLTIQGVTGMIAVDVSQSVSRWTIAHVTAVTHVIGSVYLTSQAGAAVTVTAGALDVNCTGCSSSATVHISSAIHVAGTLSGARFHIQGVGTPGQSHGGVLTVQGVTGMVAVDVSQSVSPWVVAHLSSVAHVIGRVYLTNQAGAAVTVSSGALDVNCTGCSSSATVHISSAIHIAGTQNGGRVHVSGLGTPGQTHGGVFTVQGVTGMIGIAVYQDTPRWTVAHITSVTHIYGTASLVARDGTYAGFAGTSILVAASSAQSGSWSIQAAHQGGEWNVGHVTSVVHVAIAAHAVIRVMGAHVTGAIHVAGLTNVGSGAPNTGTTQMVCHSTLAVHVAAAAPGYTQIIHLTSTNGGINQSTWRIYICSILIVSAHAQGFSLLEGTGTTCQGQVRHALIGSWRPDDSVVLAANGGFSLAAPFPTLSTQVPGNNLCIGQTSRTTGTLSGFISYRAVP